jgi:hypothetical protein
MGQQPDLSNLQSRIRLAEPGRAGGRRCGTS